MANDVVIRITDKGTAKTYAKNVDRADKATDKLVTSAKLLVVAYGALKAINIGSELAKQAVLAERANKALIAYSGSVQAAARSTEAMQSALGGTVSEFEATALATKLLALSIADTGDEAADLAGKVAALGSVFGKDATQSIEEFTLLLANNSILRLDTFGISAVVVKERIRELQAATKGLTRDAAFMTATMEQLEIKSALLGDVFSDDAAVADRYDAAMRDLSITLGDKLAPVYTTILSLATDFAETFDTFLGGENTIEAIEKRIQALKDGGEKTNLTLIKLFGTNEAIIKSLERQLILLKDKAILDSIAVQAQALLDKQAAEGTKTIAVNAKLLAEIQQDATLQLALFNKELRETQRLSSRELLGDLAGILSIIGFGGLGAGISGGLAALKGLGKFLTGRGIDILPNISAAAHGADFNTNGPELLLVGDNASGREHVQVTPDTAPQAAQPLQIVLPNDASGVILGALLRDQIIPGIAIIEAEG